MTDMRRIADLPPCGRRWPMENQDEVQIWCRAATRPPGITREKALREPGRWFGKRRVSCEECERCSENEPLRPSRVPQGLSRMAHPIEDRIPAEIWSPQEDRPNSPAPVIQGDGTIVYTKVGWEPPLVPPGYKRKSDELTSQDAWVLVRVEPLCKFCNLKTFKRASCSCLRIVPVCEYNGKSENIQLNQCESCPNKK